MKWKVQKKNNKGFSLVTVIASIAVVSVLVAMTLTLTVMNYRMKITNLNAQKNFYTAEEALDEISQGLAKQLSVSAAEAYVYTMTNYNSLSPDARYTVFAEKLTASMQKALCRNTNTTTNYSTDYLKSLLVNVPQYDKTGEGTGAEISSLSNGNFLNSSADELVLKNVIVTYYGEEDYLSEIQTDIVISYPQIEFSQSTESTSNLLNYALVAGKSVQATGANHVSVSGSAYLGSEGVTFLNSSVTFQTETGANELATLVSGSGISMDQGSYVTVKNMDVWADSILVDSSTAVMSGEIHLSNDLVADTTIATGASASVTLSGALYAYGNPEMIRQASSMSEKTQEINNNPADYSSSVILNGANSTVDLSGLTTMMIAGNSYIGATNYTGLTGNKNSADVLMGDSIAVKAQQTAYLIPAECIAPDDADGGMNPMTADQYRALKESMAAKGYTANGIVDYTKKSSTLGCSLESLGVNSYQTAYYVVNGSGTSATQMVYLFMVFDDSDHAADFASSYFGKLSNLSKLDTSLSLYNNRVLIPSALSGAENTDGYNCYLNGNVVSRAGKESTVYLSSDMTGEFSSADNDDIESALQDYCDTYFALGCKLTENYDELTSVEKTKGVYDNLVYNMASVSNTKAVIGSGNSRIFVSSDLAGENLAAVVINNNRDTDSPYVISKDTVNNISGTDENGNEVSGARLGLVIASGDVVVSTDFKGLIIAGGTITLESNAAIEADAVTAALAIMMKDQTGASVSDYLKDADSYSIGGISGSSGTGSSGDDGDSTNGAVSYASLVTYENWKKQ